MTTAHPKPQAVLPHRPPFLFIDSVVECTTTTCRAVREFRADEDFFKGHFPGRAIVPGVVLIEGMAQTMAYLAIVVSGCKGVYLVGVDKARFRKPVFPGQTVEFRVQHIGQRLGVFVGAVEAYVGETKVASAELRGMLERDESVAF